MVWYPTKNLQEFQSYRFKAPPISIEPYKDKVKAPRVHYFKTENTKQLEFHPLSKIMHIKTIPAILARKGHWKYILKQRNEV